MTRTVDPALTRRARAWIARIEKRAKAEGRGLTPWEEEFLASLDQRLEKFGSAFADPDKGQLSAPLSLLQGVKLKQIGKAADRKPEEPKRKAIRASKPGAAKSAQTSPLKRSTGLKRSGFKRSGPVTRERNGAENP